MKNLLLSVMAVLLLATSAQAKTIVFASDCTWPPMEMVDAKKQCVGFGPDLVMAIAKAAGFEAKIENTAWDGIFAGLEAGKYQAISSSVSITDERKQKYDFSEPYYEVKQAVVVKKGVAAKSNADLKGKVLGAQINTTGHFAAQKVAGAKDVKGYDEVGLAMKDLANGRVDAVICDDNVASDYALKNPDLSKTLTLGYVITEVPAEPLGFTVKKGDKETKDLIDKGLAAVKKSGDYAKLVKKWMGK
jgi:polar amino acid transport system substrate-binding protein